MFGARPLIPLVKKYYVSFIDDYNKFTWIYLLRPKLEVSKYFLEFQSLVERMLGRKIISLQSDWGGEYEKLDSFLRQVDISHHVSCPYTHQQNGYAEWKHWHITEMDLVLLAHASMPLKY
jgi:transposase InsO family protein